jgi:hypothetical protein
MLRVLDIRLASSGGLLIAVRRIEYLILLGFCAYAGLLYPPYGLLASLPLLVLALMLVPGPEAAAIQRERARMAVIRDLQAEGYRLHTSWLDVSDLPLTEWVAAEQWAIRRDAMIWISKGEARLASWPEAGGIFAAHERKQDVIEELDVCLLTLSRLRRLFSLSESLRLPI